jgi:N-acetylglucosamine malate deacetylase 1
MLPEQKILCIGAHPDDIELNCAGILNGLPFKSVNVTATLGEKVSVLYGKSAGKFSETQIKTIRKKEFLSAAKMLGSKPEILYLEDGNIDKKKLKEEIKDIIRNEKIILIITHFWDSSHTDHKRVGEAIKGLNFKIPVLYWIDYSCLSRPSNIKVNIRKYLKLKRKILSNYRSQMNFSEFRRIFSRDTSSFSEEFFVQDKDMPKINFLASFFS